MLKNFYPLVLASLGLSLASLPANPEVKADTPAAPETEAPSPAAPTTATSSEALTSQAWDAYNLRDYPTATSRAELCRKLYQAQAKEMQAKLTELPSGDAIKELWALNDVGTCTLILGMAAEGAGKNDQAERNTTRKQSNETRTTNQEKHQHDTQNDSKMSLTAKRHRNYIKTIKG